MTPSEGCGWTQHEESHLDYSHFPPLWRDGLRSGARTRKQRQILLDSRCRRPGRNDLRRQHHAGYVDPMPDLLRSKPHHEAVRAQLRCSLWRGNEPECCEYLGLEEAQRERFALVVGAVGRSDWITYRSGYPKQSD